jgi:hypothetical protein
MWTMNVVACGLDEELVLFCVAMLDSGLLSLTNCAAKLSMCELGKL